MNKNEIYSLIKRIIQHPKEEFCYYISQLEFIHSILKEPHGKKYYQLLIHFPKGWKNKDPRIPRIREEYKNIKGNGVKWTIVERKSYEPPVTQTSIQRALEREYNIDNDFPNWQAVSPYYLAQELSSLQNLLYLSSNSQEEIKDWKAFKEVYITSLWKMIKAVDWLNKKALEEPLTHLRIIAEGKYGKRLEKRKLNKVIGWEGYSYKLENMEKWRIKIAIENPYLINKTTFENLSNLLLNYNPLSLPSFKDVFIDLLSFSFFPPAIAYRWGKESFKKEKNIKKAIIKGLSSYLITSFFFLTSLSIAKKDIENYVEKEGIRIELENAQKEIGSEEIKDVLLYGITGVVKAKEELKKKLPYKGVIKYIEFTCPYPSPDEGKGNLIITFKHPPHINEPLDVKDIEGKISKYCPISWILKTIESLDGKTLSEIINNEETK